MREGIYIDPLKGSVIVPPHKKTVYPSTIITHCVKIQIIQYDDDSLGFQSTSSVQVLGVN